MVIVVNTRLLLKNRLEGIGWFTYETLKRITCDHPEHHFIFLFDRKYDEEFVFAENVKPVVVWPPTRHVSLMYLWFNWRIPGILKKYKADVFVSPDGNLSLHTKIPQLAVIHDINFVHRPKDLPRVVAKYYNYFFPRFARIAKKVVTVSTFSKNDIALNFDISADKIEVVYNGCNSEFLPITEEKVAATRSDYSSGEPYFLFIGALHPRKNVEGLLRAFDLFRLKTRNKEKLLIVGGQMFKTSSISETLNQMQFKDEVIFTGRLPTTDLKKVLGGALALTFVPFFEGFGIPVLEAFSAGIPVICSDTTSLPEVGGDAVLYVNPEKDEEIAEAMRQISHDDNLRSTLIEKGNRQLTKFSWDDSAEKLWEIIEQTGRL
jgi:glycosyltransferase involved in cell wall biosynthesis